MRLWRISNFADLSGFGGTRAAGRWHHRGTPIIYCSDHPAAALLEILVHVDAEDAPSEYQLLGIDVPETVPVTIAELPEDWRDNEPGTQRVGMEFLRKGDSPVLEVPSALVPFTSNYLLNPDLVGTSNIRIVSQTMHPIDPRLFA